MARPTNPAQPSTASVSSSPRSDIAIAPQELIAEGDQVVVRFLVSGTHTGPHPRMPQPTGRRFEVEQIWIFTLDRGKVTEIRAVSDRLGLFAQLGRDWPT
jgi:predicted ester cyclase